MARRAVRVTRPARLGLGALAIIIVAGTVAFIGLRISRSNGYEIGVHFPTAAGVAPGAQVYQSGVVVGNVRKIVILPDASLDFIIGIQRNIDIPKNAKFSIQTSFTGNASVTIMPPEPRQLRPEPATPLPADQVLPKRVLPLAEQPIGNAPLSLEAFMSQGRALGDRAYAVLSEAKPYGKHMLYHLRHAQSSAAATTGEMRGVQPQLMAAMQSTITRARANVAQAQTALQEHNQAKVEAIASAFQGTLAAMNRTADALGSVRRDGRMQSNVREASAQLKSVISTMAQLSHDLEMIAGNPQTKAQLRDAGARLRAILQKI